MGAPGNSEVNPLGTWGMGSGVTGEIELDPGCLDVDWGTQSSTPWELGVWGIKLQGPKHYKDRGPLGWGRILQKPTTWKPRNTPVEKGTIPSEWNGIPRLTCNHLSSIIIDPGDSDYHGMPMGEMSWEFFPFSIVEEGGHGSFDSEKSDSLKSWSWSLGIGDP